MRTAALVLASVDVNPLNWFQTSVFGVVLVSFVWGFAIKNPPLFVTWREHKRALDQLDYALAELREQRAVTGDATDTTRESAEALAKAAEALRDKLAGKSKPTVAT